MLFIGLYPTAVALGTTMAGWDANDGRLWEKLRMVLCDGGNAVEPDQHQRLEWIKGNWNHCIFVYLAEAEAEEQKKCAGELVCDLPSSAGQNVVEGGQAKELGEREAQI